MSRLSTLAMGALLTAAALAAPLAAQSGSARTTVRTAAMLRATPGGSAVGVLRAGTVLTVGEVRDDVARVTVEGFLPRASVGDKIKDFSASVRGGGRVTLRREGSTGGSAMGDLMGGSGVERVERRGEWVRVRRSGWVSRTTLDSVPGPPARAASAPKAAASTPVAAKTAAPKAAPSKESAGATTAAKPAGATEPAVADSATATSGAPAPDASSVQAVASTPLRATPNGGTTATIAQGAPATVLARDGAWTKVRVEGWVRAEEVRLVQAGPRALAAADLRADPAATLGKLVEWEVELLALQRGDTLRRDLMPGEPYFLARGPGSEGAVLYLTIPKELLAAARAARVPGRARIVARVRSGRSEPTGVPVLDVQVLTLIR
jgi:hypothetical protein